MRNRSMPSLALPAGTRPVPIASPARLRLSSYRSTAGPVEERGFVGLVRVAVDDLHGVDQER